MSQDIQMRPMPSYNTNNNQYMGGGPPKRMASQESVTSEGSTYLEPTRTSSQPSHSIRGSLPGEHDSGVVDVDGIQQDFLSDSTLPTNSPRSSLQTSNTPSPQKSSLPYPYQGQGHLKASGQSPPYPAKMKRPDSLAGKGHEYEELPHSRYTNPARPYYNESATGQGPSDMGRPQPPSLAKLVSLNSNGASRGSLENLCEAQDPVVTERPQTTHRRRQNPLYDSADHEEEEDYKSKRRKSERCQCPCFLQFLIAIIAIVALLLAILSLTGAMEDEDAPKASAQIQPPSNTSILEQRLKELEDKYLDLLKKQDDDVQLYKQNISENARNIEAMLNMSRLIESLTGEVEHWKNISVSQQQSLLELESRLENQTDQFTELQNQQENQSRNLATVRKDVTAHSERFGDVETEVADLETSFNSRMSAFDTSLLNLQANVTKVSKMEGPQGPPGVGNLTACQRLNRRTSTSSEAPITITSWVPENQQEADASVILGVECTTEGGETSILESKTVQQWTTGANFQYRCACRGKVNSSTTRKCELIYWTCPRIS